MLTHLHSDHSMGLVDEAGQHGVSQRRADHPRGRGGVLARPRDCSPSDPERIAGNSKKQRAVTAPYRDRIRRIKDGEVLPGITAMLRPGHTPGHTNWLIQSGGERLLIWGDIVHLAAVQMARPDARLIYDVDTDLAAATRQTVLEWAASERLMRRRRASRLSRASAAVATSGDRFAIEAIRAALEAGQRADARGRSSDEVRPYSPATFGITSFENSRSERSAISTGMLPGVKCSDTLSMPPTLSL